MLPEHRGYGDGALAPPPRERSRDSLEDAYPITVVLGIPSEPPGSDWWVGEGDARINVGVAYRILPRTGPGRNDSAPARRLYGRRVQRPRRRP
jgi:hypothetical protein